MTRKGLRHVGLLVGLLGVASGCVDDGGPRLVSVSPARAQRETVVTLSGSRLCGGSADCATAAGEILIGIEQPQVRAPVVSYEADRAEIRIPSVAPLGKSKLVVTVDGRSSNTVDFEVLP